MVREKKLHAEVVGEIIDFCRSIDLEIIDLTYSPVKGPAGNIEFLIHLQLRSGQKDLPVDNSADLDGLIQRVIDEAHIALN